MSIPRKSPSPSLAAAVMHVAPLAVFAAFLLAIAAGSGLALRERNAFERIRLDMRSVGVIAPQGIPDLRQESIDVAMELYSIEAPSAFVGPILDTELEDRGLTTGGTLSPRKNVTIGPAAFASWGVLGSTLGHEIEVHVHQSFLAVVVLDRLSGVQLAARQRLGALVPALAPSVRESFENGGSWRAEREAYRYELASRARFGLSEPETKSIRSVMDYYYPDVRAPGGAGISNAEAGGDLVERPEGI